MTFLPVPLGRCQPGRSRPVAGGRQREKEEPLYKISLTQYSLHRMIGGGKLDNMDFTSFPKEGVRLYGRRVLEPAFFSKAKDKAYVGQMRKRADDAGVGATVILIDGEGNLGDPDRPTQEFGRAAQEVGRGGQGKWAATRSASTPAPRAVTRTVGKRRRRPEDAQRVFCHDQDERDRREPRRTLLQRKWLSGV
ncbi:MAG: hypothetical protein Ct9H300mP1_00850 [Planctomycetaceae bacterium]|nr:MAG: hypothetical protein Ct9H300mP1_00850 [Planctomycetaceae bacterium]